MSNELERIYVEVDKAEENYDEFTEEVYKLAALANSHSDLEVEMEDYNLAEIHYTSTERIESKITEQFEEVESARIEMHNSLYRLDIAVAKYQHQEGHFDSKKIDLPESYEELREEQEKLEELNEEMQDLFEDLSLQIAGQTNEPLTEEILEANNRMPQRKKI